MSTLDTMRSKDELRTMAAIQNMAPMVERIAGNISRQVDIQTRQAEAQERIAVALEALADPSRDRLVVGIEGIAEVIDQHDTNIGHHLGDVVEAIKAS